MENDKQMQQVEIVEIIELDDIALDSVVGGTGLRPGGEFSDTINNCTINNCTINNCIC